MESFKLFFESKLAEEDKNIRGTLQKLPKAHRALVQGYKYELQQGNTLDGDDEHVGCIDDKKKTVFIAAPWCYGREFTFLHEVAHKVWNRLSREQRKEWNNLAKKSSIKETAEELFCHAYAHTYSKNKLVKYNYPDWEKFVKGLK